MARRKKSNTDDMWGRRQLNLALINIGISVLALGVSLCNKPVIVQAPAPVQPHVVVASQAVGSWEIVVLTPHTGQLRIGA
jgi:hypothetical protein